MMMSGDNKKKNGWKHMIRVSDFGMPAREDLAPAERDVMECLDKILEHNGGHIETIPPEYDIDFDRLAAGDPEMMARVAALHEYVESLK